MEKEVFYYKTLEGRRPFINWMLSLRDKMVRYRIDARIDRMRNGNYGDHKRFNGIIEVRMHFGKGYRLYCMEEGSKIIILLIGGDKSSQAKDIKEALEYGRDYYEQK